MNTYSANWLDECEKGQKAIANVIDYILKEYCMSEEVNQFDLEKRCEIKFEVYSHPTYTEYQTSLETLVQVLRITGVLNHE